MYLYLNVAVVYGKQVSPQLPVLDSYYSDTNMYFGNDTQGSAFAAKHLFDQPYGIVFLH